MWDSIPPLPNSTAAELVPALESNGDSAGFYHISVIVIISLWSNKFITIFPWTATELENEKTTVN